MMIQQLAYVMAMQAEGNDFKKINFDSFLGWVSEFEAMDLVGGQIAADILAVYTANNKTLSKAKKNRG